MDTFHSMMEKSLCCDENNYPEYLTMRASNYAKQNDPTECKLFFNALLKKVKQYMQERNIVLSPENERLLREPPYGMNLFTVSFSEQEDDLTMWRGYGQNGDGISLGFDFSELPDPPMAYCICGIKDYDPPKADTEILYKHNCPIQCKYVRPDEDFLDNDIIKKTVDNLMSTERGLNDIAQGMLSFDKAPKYKHYKYAQEKEYRIIRTSQDIKYQMKNDKLLKTYIEIKIAISCLKKIIVGPCQAYNSKMNAYMISNYLSKKGLSIEVVESEIPYRQGF